MRMGRNTWVYLVLVLILACPSSAMAEDYYWRITSQVFPDPSGNQVNHSSAGSACAAYFQAVKTPVGGSTKVLVYGAQAVCQILNSLGTAAYSGSAVRYGTACKLGYTYDAAAGACLPPPGGQSCDGPIKSNAGNITNAEGQCVDFWNADTPSQCKSLAGTTRAKNLYINFDSDGNPQTPPPVNAGGCETSPIDVSHCTMAPKRVFPTGGSIQPTSNKCKIGVTFTGGTIGSAPVSPPQSTGPGDDGLCVGECPDIPPAPIDNDTQPCTYVYDGEGRKVCSSSNFNYQPGNSSCGSVNGVFQCVGKAPSTNGIVIDTVVTDTTNPDGSKASVKKDTATQIICNSPKPCVSTTTTNTTTTNYNSNGAKTGQSTSCTGAACSTDGKGDADGDGLQDCAVGKCEETEGVDVGAQDWHETGEETFGSAFEGFTSRVSSAPVMKAGDKFFAFNPSGSCPVWSVNTWVFSFTLDQHCSTDIPWEVIKAIIMACAGFVAFRWALL